MGKFLIVSLPFLFCALGAQARPRLLVFSKVEPGGYYHEVIPLAAATVIRLGGETGFDVDTTSDASAFTPGNLARYQAVFFNHVYGEVFDTAQQNAFQGFIRGGNGFAGIHASCYAELQWPWYKGLVGAYFKTHPGIASATLKVEDRTHLSTAALPEKWTRTDEWYDFDSNPRASVHVLITIDEQTYPGGGMGADHPMVWYHAYDGGRAWFSGMGHMAESYSDALFVGHLRGGIQYALGMTPVGIALVPRKKAGTLLDSFWPGGPGSFRGGFFFLPEGFSGKAYSADGAIMGPGSRRLSGIP